MLGTAFGMARRALRLRRGNLDVDTVVTTGSGVSDAPKLPDLLGRIPEGEQISSDAADGAYDAHGCRDAIAGWRAEADPDRRTKSLSPSSTDTRNLASRLLASLSQGLSADR